MMLLTNTQYKGVLPPRVSCVDLLAMRSLCKIKWEKFLWILPLAIVEMKEKGMLSEEWFDRHSIVKDATAEGDVIEKNVPSSSYTCNGK